MKKIIEMSQLRPFDMTEYLQEEQAKTDYLAIVQEENDPIALEQALKTVSRALNLGA
jgi:DNA-binding phage protein